jgi:septal ring factor EnvC (AmiA/AmiB activator)
MKHFLAVFGFSLTLFACTHTPEEKYKNNYQESAEARIERMEDNIERLSERAQELLGEPRANLQSAIDNLSQQMREAKMELSELRDRGTDTWLEKKASTDQQLNEMDDAYNEALKTIAAD